MWLSKRKETKDFNHLSIKLVLFCLFYFILFTVKYRRQSYINGSYRFHIENYIMYIVRQQQ